MKDGDKTRTKMVKTILDPIQQSLRHINEWQKQPEDAGLQHLDTQKTTSMTSLQNILSKQLFGTISVKYKLQFPLIA